MLLAVVLEHMSSGDIRRSMAPSRSRAKPAKVSGLIFAVAGIVSATMIPARVACTPALRKQNQTTSPSSAYGTGESTPAREMTISTTTTKAATASHTRFTRLE